MYTMENNKPNTRRRPSSFFDIFYALSYTPGTILKTEPLLTNNGETVPNGNLYDLATKNRNLY